MNAYERYEKRMRDLARVLATLKKNLPYIAIGVALLSAVVVMLLMITGNITETVSCSDITYGDALHYRVGVLWTDARFEFSSVGSDERTSEVPTMPGRYVIHAYGENVFGQRKYSECEFTIAKRVLTLKLSGVNVTYGDEISIDDAVSIYGLLSTDTLSPFSFVYDRSLIGNSPITVDTESVTVTNSDGEDVTSAYDIRVISAYVTVKKRSITISTSSFLKVYDSTPLESDGAWKLEEGSLASGDSAEFRIGGSITEVGEIPNSVIYTHITNADGKNVSDCYEIIAREGTIKVVKGRVTLRVNDLTRVYNGTGQTPERVTVDSGTLYDGDRLGSVVYSGSGTDVGEYLLGLRSYAIMNGERDVTDDYIIDVIEGTLTITPIELKIKTSTDTFVYNGKDYSGSFSLVDGEVAYNHTLSLVSKTERVRVGNVENVCTVAVLDAEGNDVTKNYRIEYDYGTLSVTPAKLKLKFEDTYSEYIGETPTVCKYSIVYGGLASGDLLQCAPKNEMIDVGEYKNEFIISVIHSSGIDVTDCYEIDAEFGSLYIQQKRITVVVESQSFIYDGTEKTYHSIKTSIGALPDGHMITNVKYLSSLTKPALIENKIEKDVRIINAEGRDVTHNFHISYDFGILEVVKRGITVTSKLLEKVYDGIPLVYNEGFTYEVQEFGIGGADKNRRGLLAGHTLQGNTDGYSRTDCGTTVIKVKDFKIYDENGEDVTYCYNISEKYGTLRVTNRRIKIITATASKLYDGTPLTDDSYTVEHDGPAAGEFLDFAIIGTITEPGSTPNITTQICVKRADGTDSTSNYSIYSSIGTLTVIDPNAPTTDVGGTGSDDPVGTGTGGSQGNGGGTDRNDTPKNEPGFALDPNGNLGISDIMPGTQGGQLEGKSAFSVYSTESHTAYLKYMSFGDYNGQKWEKAPVYGALLDGKYSFEYLTGIALSRSNMRRINMKLKLKVADYLLPYYLGIDESNYTIQKDDSVHYGNANEEYAVYYYYYDIATSGIPKVTLGEYTNREFVYRQYVYKRYLDLPVNTRKYCDELLKNGDFGNTTEEKIKNILEYVRSNAIYDYGYDRNLDKSYDIAVAFLRDYGEGVCQHFATAATVLFRAAGIPARYTIGWVTRTEANKWTAQKGAAHAWVEIYIDGIGWMHVDPTPTTDININDLLGALTDTDVSDTLPKEPGDATEPGSDDVLSFRTGYTGPMYFRERNYSQFVNGSWTTSEVNMINEYEKLQLILAAQALSSIGATEYSVQIDYLKEPDNLLIPYFITSSVSGKETVGDISYEFDGKMSSCYSFIPAIRSQNSFVGASLSGEYAKIEDMYRKLIRKEYLNVNLKERAFILNYFPELERHSSSTAKINYVLGIVRELMRRAELDGIEELNSLSDCIRDGYLTSEEYATTLAVLMLRIVGAPSRYVEGYISRSLSSTVTTVTESDRACWMEIYVDGIGWIPVSVRDDIPNLFEEDDDITKQNIVVTVDSNEKLYDGKPLTENGFKITSGCLLNGHTFEFESSSSQTYVGSTDNLCKHYEVIDEDGNNVTDRYNIIMRYGTLTVYPLSANPVDYIRGMTGQTLNIRNYRWWNGEARGDVSFGYVGDGDGIVLDENGILKLTQPGIYRISCSAEGVDVNGDGVYELEPIEEFEFSVIVNEFSNVFTMDITLDEAVARNYQQRPQFPSHFSPDGEHIGLVLEMNGGKKNYDGTALTADGATVINGRLRDGDTVEAKGSGSITFCGKAKNGCADLIIRDRDGEDVTYLYAVTVYPGILTVNTALHDPPANSVSIGLGETLYVGKLFISEYISNYPMSISIQQDNGCISLEGTALRGKKLGSSVLKVTLYGCDLNGDGFSEYSQHDYYIKISTTVAAWQIALGVLFLAALGGYIVIVTVERRSKKEKTVPNTSEP